MLANTRTPQPGAGNAVQHVKEHVVTAGESAWQLLSGRGSARPRPRCRRIAVWVTYHYTPDGKTRFSLLWGRFSGCWHVLCSASFYVPGGAESLLSGRSRRFSARRSVIRMGRAVAGRETAAEASRFVTRTRWCHCPIRHTLAVAVHCRFGWARYPVGVMPDREEPTEFEEEW